ncbi:adenylate/guanylate cyclase domain-containing protein [Ruegeria atlantica]|uniref:adenylate/guanylate cyclase domain-containing protein n=1 Tax=Ruegeria atlantica TaxID=81569 RepID=UPI002494E615|nr:adenylate/guanylate cyclase domain-containing protein [Ruegeria atlantica]
MERRIAAILAADMVGFSRLIELDENGTLIRQKEHRVELIEPTIQKRNGRVIKLTGDGFIAEFASVVEALQTAVHLQKELTTREASRSEDRRTVYRMAIHLGDIVEDDGDIYGDGVNIAARLEGLAPPGGIVVSGTAHDLIKSQVEVDYVPLGDKRLKNIATPVRVLQVVELGTKPSRRIKKRVFLPFFAAVICALAVVGWLWPSPGLERVDPSEMALELPLEPSIAVLPFKMRGGRAEEDWVADAITESIIATLSLSPDMTVISYSTVSGYSGEEMNASDAARELGVRYILTGSVLPSGDSYRVTAELANMVDGKQVWSLQKDSPANDLLAVQDNIARRIFEELSISLTVGETARSWIEAIGGFENYVKMINGRSEFQKFSPEGHAKAERIWGDIYRDNPDQAFVNHLIGYLYWQKPILGISTDPISDRETAMNYANRALEIEEFGEGYTLAALLTLAQGSYSETIALADKAVALSPGSADVNSLAGQVKLVSGQTLEGLELLERGMRLEPDYPEWLPDPINMARMELGKYDEAKTLANQVLASNPKDVRAKRDAAAVLVAVAVFEGDMEEARRQMENLLELFPGANSDWAARERSGFKNQDFTSKYIDALIQAGLPDT